MPAFTYIGPRVLHAGAVEIEVPDRAFRVTGPGELTCGIRQRREALTFGETRRPTLMKNATVVKVSAKDRFLADWFRLARSVEGLPLFKEIQ